jgi:hypothetical protein
MKLNYLNIRVFLRQHFRWMLVAELLCLAAGGIYLALAPRIYEANLAVMVPKTQKIISSSPLKLEWANLISSLDYMRSLQNPLRYPDQFMIDCMGADTNANRKQWINSIQPTLLSNGDVIQFSIRLEGKREANHCANLLQNLLITDLLGIYDSQTQKAAANLLSNPALPVLQFEKPAVFYSIRISDNYVQPNVYKVMLFSALVGIFFGIFGPILRDKYRA